MYSCKTHCETYRTMEYGLLYTRNGFQECIGYADADCGGDANDYKSTSGYIFQIENTTVILKSKKQTYVYSRS